MIKSVKELKHVHYSSKHKSRVTVLYSNSTKYENVWLASSVNTTQSKNYLVIIEDAMIMFDSFGVRVMVFNTTFINIAVISWWSVLLVEENRVHWVSHWQTLSHNIA